MERRDICRRSVQSDHDRGDRACGGRFGAAWGTETTGGDCGRNFAGARELLRGAATVELVGGELDVDTATDLAEAMRLFR